MVEPRMLTTEERYSFCVFSHEQTMKSVLVLAVQDITSITYTLQLATKPYLQLFHIAISWFANEDESRLFCRLLDNTFIVFCRPSKNCSTRRMNCSREGHIQNIDDYKPLKLATVLTTQSDNIVALHSCTFTPRKSTFYLSLVLDILKSWKNPASTTISVVMATVGGSGKSCSMVLYTLLAADLIWETNTPGHLQEPLFSTALQHLERQDAIGPNS